MRPNLPAMESSYGDNSTHLTNEDPRKCREPSIVTKITQLGGERGLNPTYCLFIILLFLPITLVALPIGKFLGGPVVVRNHFGQNEGILEFIRERVPGLYTMEAIGAASDKG